MAAFSNTQKLHVVTRLACFHTATEVQKELKETFTLEASLQQILFYDPTTVQGARELGKQWKELFWQTRERFIDDETAIPIAHRTYRLRRLQQIVDSSKSPAMVKDVLEQAAKEVGGLYTNKRDITSDGKSLAALSDEELDRRIAAAEGRKAQAAGGGGASGPGGALSQSG